MNLKFKNKNSKFKDLFILTFAFCFLIFNITFGLELSDIKIKELHTAPAPTWGRDPFIRYEDRFKKLELKEELELFRIDGIISNGKRAVVIINKGFYRKGDRVEGFTITDISGDKVLVEKNGRKFYLGIDRFAIREKR